MEKKKKKGKVSTSTPGSGVSFVVDTNYEFNNVRLVAGEGVFSNYLSDNEGRCNAIHLRGGWTELRTIFQLLPPAVQERVRRYPWRHLYQIQPRNHRTQGVQVILERCCKTTNTFFFRDFECGVPSIDLYMLTEIPCQGNLLPYNRLKWLSENRWKERLPLYSNDLGGNPTHRQLKVYGLKVSGLKSFFQRYALRMNQNREAGDQHLIPEHFEELENAGNWIFGQEGNE